MSTYGYSNFDDDIQENDGSQNDGSIKRKGRGYDKPKWGKLGKESIEFTKDGLCVVPKDAKLARYLGSLARNYNLLPLSPINWRAYDDAHMDKLWKIIYDTIDWRPEDIPHIPKIRHALLKRLSKRVRNNRADLKNKYYTPHIGSPSRFTCGDSRVDNDQWREMVNYWDSDPKNKIRVERNIENRKKLKMSHTGGSMSFVRHYAGYEKEHGHELDPIEAYELVHKRKDEQRSWVDDASEQMGALISQKLAELVDSNGDATPEVRLQAYVSARGFETGSRVRGYGEVVTPDMVSWVRETQPTPTVRRSRRGRAYALLQSECLSLKEMYEKQQMINEKQGKEIEELRHMIQSSQNLSSNPQSPPEQPSSAQEEPLNTTHQPVTQHQPPNQQQFSSQQQPVLQQNLSYPQFGPIYYPHPYHPSMFAQVSQPTRDFTSTLNDMDFLQFMAQGSTSDMQNGTNGTDHRHKQWDKGKRSNGSECPTNAFHNRQI